MRTRSAAPGPIPLSAAADAELIHEAPWAPRHRSRLTSGRRRSRPTDDARPLRRMRRTRHTAVDAGPWITFTGRSLDPQFGAAPTARCAGGAARGAQLESLADVGQLRLTVGHAVQLAPRRAFRAGSRQATVGLVHAEIHRRRRAGSGLVDGRRRGLGLESRPGRHVNARLRLIRRDRNGPERLRTCIVRMDRNGRGARFADRFLTLAAARLIIQKHEMPRRPAVRALVIADLCDAREEPVRLGKPTDHALIAARPGGHAHSRVARLRSHRAVNGGRPDLHRTTSAARNRERHHRQRASRGDRLHYIARPVPSQRRVELLTPGSARARARIGEQLIRQTAFIARRRTLARRTAHGGRRVGETGVRSRQHIRARRGRGVRSTDPQEAERIPVRGGVRKANSRAATLPFRAVAASVAALRRVAGARVGTAARDTDEDKGKKWREKSHRLDDHCWQQIV